MTLDALSSIVCFATFLGLYSDQRRRATHAGNAPPIEWGWLGAITAIVVVIVLVTGVR